MARLPTPGSDSGNWGTILNDFLDVSHNDDGSLRNSAVGQAGGLLASNNLNDVKESSTALNNIGGWPFSNPLADVSVFLNADGVTAVAMARDGTVLESSSGDHAPVFQAAVDALKGTANVRIEFNGIFNFESGITVYAGIALIGRGYTTAGASQHDHGSLINATGNEPVITLAIDPDNTGRLSFPYLDGFTIYGNGYGDSSMTAQDAIYCSADNGGIYDLVAHNLGLFGCGGAAFHNDSSNLKAWISDCYFERDGTGVQLATGQARFTRINFSQCTNWGIDATSGGQLVVTDSRIYSNVAGGILLASNTLGAKIKGNSFSNNGSNSNTAPSIYIKSAANVSGSIAIGDNDFYDTRGSGNVINHIYVGYGEQVTQTIIHDNAFSGQSSTGVGYWARDGHSLIVHDNKGYNDTVGKLATPFHTSFGAIAPYGTASAPTASTTYTATTGAVYVVSASGTGVSITVTDPASNTMQSGLTAYSGILPPGWSINFGAFSAVPSVTVSVA